MIIKAFKIEIATDKGVFGFDTTFADNLNIIRGDNSSGKSTLYNSLIYSIGMEELIGGTGNKALPYAVKEWFYLEENKEYINSSSVYAEIDNQLGKTITLKRVITHPEVSPKLIEIYEGPMSSATAGLITPIYTYLHDAGGATKEQGFHLYLERFLNLNLPQVPSSNGGQTKLYLQTIFAGLIVEQKRGWSDYMANIPYFQIRDARAHVAEFLLNLNVFETNSIKDTLNQESIKIFSEWDSAFKDALSQANESGLLIDGMPNRAIFDFSISNTMLLKVVPGGTTNIESYLQDLVIEYKNLDLEVKDPNSNASQLLLSELDKVMSEIQEYSALYEKLSSNQSIQTAALSEYKKLYEDNNEDLERNKAVKKLKDLGAKNNLEISHDDCPTCSQPINDALLSTITLSHPMAIDENIEYLKRQSEMLERQSYGLVINLENIQNSKNEINRRINEKRSVLEALRKDIYEGESNSKAKFRRQMQIEEEIRKINKGIDSISSLSEKLVSLSERLKLNRENRKKLPPSAHSDSDLQKIGIFQSYFRSNASAFGYTSAAIEEIFINPDSLTPHLASIELKQLRERQNNADIKSDSSASDFVRLIWSYLLSLYQTSSFQGMNGNHPGIILMDEPGQHSMGEGSQNALLKQLASQKKLQSIIAASFDESDHVFMEATVGIDFKLIRLNKKFIQPLPMSS